MKNIFKIMGVALLASSMILVSCKKDDPITNNDEEEVTYKITVTTNDESMGTVTISPAKESYKSGETVTLTATANEGYMFVNWNDQNTDNPRTITVSKNANFMANFDESDEPSIKIMWGGVEQELNYTDGIFAGMHYMFYAAKGTQGQNVIFPYFVINYDCDPDPTYGVTLAAKWNYTTQLGETLSGYEVYPTYVYDSIAINDRGDYELATVNDPTNVRFDANAHTLSCDMTQTMFNNYDYLQNIAALGLPTGTEPTEEQQTAALQNSRTKTLTVMLKNWVFEAYSGKQMPLVK